MMKSMEEFIETRIQSSKSTFSYSKLNKNIELLSELVYLALVKVTIPFNMIPALLINLFNYYVLDMDDESFYLPFPTILPLGLVPPFGYLVCWCIQTAAIFCVFSTVIPLTCLFLGVCWLFYSIIGDISSDLADLEGNQRSKATAMSTSTSTKTSKTSSSKSLSTSSRTHPLNDQELKVQLCSIVKLFSEFKEIMLEFNAISELNIFIIFLWGLLTITSTLLVFLTELSTHNENSNLMGLITPLTILTWSFIILANISECGQRVTGQFDLFNDKLNRCKWYCFPLDVQRILLIFLSDAQQTTYVRGYANIVCTRDSFKKTVHGGFSYFMLIRQIDG